MRSLKQHNIFPPSLMESMSLQLQCQLRACPDRHVASYRVSPKIRQGLILIFAPKNTLGLIFRGRFIYFFHVQSTFIQIQSCHVLLVAAQGWKAGFHLTRAYFGGRAYMTSILKKHTRAYFQGNREEQQNIVEVTNSQGCSTSEAT